MDWIELFSTLGESILTWLTSNSDLWITFILTLVISKLYFRYIYIKRFLPEDIKLKLNLKDERIKYCKDQWDKTADENKRLREIINGFEDIRSLNLKTNKEIGEVNEIHKTDM